MSQSNREAMTPLYQGHSPIRLFAIVLITVASVVLVGMLLFAYFKGVALEAHLILLILWIVVYLVVAILVVMGFSSFWWAVFNLATLKWSDTDGHSADEIEFLRAGRKRFHRSLLRSAGVMLFFGLTFWLINTWRSPW